MSLEKDNRLCLCSFMAAEYDDLPEAVKIEVQAFADVNVAWLEKVLEAAGIGDTDAANRRAKASSSQHAADGDDGKPDAPDR